MITVHFTKHDSVLTSLKVTGHAKSDDKGLDLVCAGVSSIVFGAINGFDQLANGNFDIEVSDNLIYAKALNSACVNDKLLNFVLIQLQTVEQSYSKNIKINIMEV